MPPWFPAVLEKPVGTLQGQGGHKGLRELGGCSRGLAARRADSLLMESVMVSPDPGRTLDVSFCGGGILVFENFVVEEKGKEAEGRTKPDLLGK